MTNLDIDKSWPKWNKFATTREASNPLNPVYRLAKVEYVQPEPPKFIRDTMALTNIEGARPKKIRELSTRETNKTADIDGASPKMRKQRKMLGGYNSLDYNDVTK